MKEKVISIKEYLIKKKKIVVLADFRKSKEPEFEKISTELFSMTEEEALKKIKKLEKNERKS